MIVLSSLSPTAFCSPQQWFAPLNNMQHVRVPFVITWHFSSSMSLEYVDDCGSQKSLLMRQQICSMIMREMVVCLLINKRKALHDAGCECEHDGAAGAEAGA